MHWNWVQGPLPQRRAPVVCTGFPSVSSVQPLIPPTPPPPLQNRRHEDAFPSDCATTCRGRDYMELHFHSPRRHRGAMHIQGDDKFLQLRSRKKASKAAEQQRNIKFKSISLFLQTFLLLENVTLRSQVTKFLLTCNPAFHCEVRKSPQI